VVMYSLSLELKTLSELSGLIFQESSQVDQKRYVGFESNTLVYKKLRKYLCI